VAGPGTNDISAGRRKLERQIQPTADELAIRSCRPYRAAERMPAFMPRRTGGLQIHCEVDGRVIAEAIVNQLRGVDLHLVRHVLRRQDSVEVVVRVKARGAFDGARPRLIRFYIGQRQQTESLRRGSDCVANRCAYAEA
jgi:hypothetical protein